MENQEAKSLKIQRGKVRIIKTLLSPEIGALMIGIVIVIITVSINPKFLSADNIWQLLRNCSFIGILSIGQALIIMSGEMDLSVGNVSSFATVVFGIVCIWNTYPVWLGLLAAAGTAAAVGFLNGFLMLKVGVMKWVATLATSNLCAGLALYIAKGVPITPMPKGLGDIGNITVGPVSIIFLIFVVLVFIGELIIRYTKYGRMIQACGISSESAYMAGVNVKKVKWITLIFVSLLAFVAGLLSCMLHRVVQPGGLTGADFKSIAACYVGGIGFVGSSGSILGLFFGVILIQMIENSMSSIGWDPNAQIFVLGFLVMVVLILDVMKRRYMASRIDLI